jgi:Cu(I)/Ag(I) efflux system membrane protein CusA/SilA
MIERVIEYSIRNRFLVMLLAAALAVWGVYAVLHTPVDAIPDLSENQVIVFTDWMGRSPREIEDQITYPLSLKLEGLAGVKTIRSSSEFNFSMITIIFEDNLDFYFARQRVLEKLTLAGTFLPQGIVPYLAADATALGQIYWYTIEGGGLDPARLWALQKYYVGPQLNSAAGVAEVATVGGMPKEYQIDIDPSALRAYGITLREVYDAVSRSNSAVGGRVIQKNNAEYLVRGVGWLGSLADIENIVVKEVQGTPLYVKTVASVQVGTQFRRSVFEKDGNEAVGGVVMMRFGENPLAVTERVKAKIQEMQPGLPQGVRVVPAYDRTRLITGAIANLKEVMLHEMIIASLAVLLILMHLRSAFVICITLPLSVLFSFLLMWILRQLNILDVQANIMSLAGITISIGILVDQAIVMTENATHHLKEQFGDQRVTGDTRDVVIRACRTVGRPIFFSVMIMLISFIPVFALSGREGKLFHPLALTKSFALLGVALISVTVVPAMIPTFLKGRLRGEEENWIVRSFINIYTPVLDWALDRRNAVMWAFAALLILAAGMFPLQAVAGQGTSEKSWQAAFFLVFGLVTVLTVTFTRGALWQVVALVTLVPLGLWAYHFPKIGVTFMPALDEGSILDMPITVPRASITESADDIKARDALLRQFPEVESVIGKAGRADTPTDPAPLDMIETFVNLRPRELWPKRVLKFDDATRQTRLVLAALEARANVATSADGDERDSLVNEVTMNAIARFDESMRELALRRYTEYEHELRDILTRFAVDEAIRRFRAARRLAPSAGDLDAAAQQLARALSPEYGTWLARQPSVEDVDRLTRAVAAQLAAARALRGEPARALSLKQSRLQQWLAEAEELLGGERRTFAGEILDAISRKREALWREQVQKTNWELFDRGVETYTWNALEEIAPAAKSRGLLAGAAHGHEYAIFAEEAAKARAGKQADQQQIRPFAELRANLEKPFAKQVLLWQREGGPKGDLHEELDTVVQVPGWSNIWTQPIANRIDMLATGVRTTVGVRVFGPDLKMIDGICRQIERVLKPVKGARDVIAEPIMGKGYLEIVIDRQRAARYGVSVGDIQDTIEVALGGRVITQTVEGRERFPVRIRYTRDFREDEESVGRLLVSRSNMPSAAMPSPTPWATEDPHQAAPLHSVDVNPPLQIPLKDVADVRIVEGPSMIKSENGRLRNYVTMNVSADRDLVGFVEDAQREVAAKVTLPEGVHVEWSGEFEHQVRAARTLRFVFPVVILLIFIILYLTYNDLADAGLMMLAVPEALAGGAFFQFLFPKIVHGWSAPPVEFSVAVWVGYIACFGMATETGIIMLVYLREAIEKRGGLEKIASLAELRQAVIEGAVHRLRPKLLTEGVAIIAIAPMLWASGVGAEIIAPMAVPVLGGLLISDEVVDIFLPVRFYWVRRARWLKLHGLTDGDSLASKPPAAKAREETIDVG